MNPVLALMITNLIWGAAAPIFKLALQNIPLFTLAFFRFFFASLFMFPLGWKYWQPITLKQFFSIFLLALFAITVNIGFYFLALPKTVSINAPIIGSAQPIFLYLLSIFILKEKPHKRVLWGIIISFLGVMTIVLSPLFLDGGMTLLSKEKAMEGNLLLIIATLGSVMGVLMLKKMVKTVNHFQITSISFIFGALTFFPLMLPELNTWSLSQLDYRGLIGIIFGAFFSSTIAYSLFNYGISKINAQEVGIFSYIDPIIAVLLAIPLLHEYPTPFFYIGSIFVFGGILIAEGRIHYHPLHLLKRINKTKY
ncbi:hypothetical protein COY87_03050 [Candidatus Roizmanbacteria bacterium CG_4_10_14_0_8_um_filter_33_9]|uniref:EamA domain-containing protein n=1 Tax=Candidatus Roizmanbacteria bacterium CG_4_10_14_0_8_um_filter_33_9 TaxID=1974826 RepID=A0A2M7QI99_9BACT|nr:MAG: hypothetical protein COY87_03050 [Candidatus Roizmanbacteria bacterium CG_4_10_14_0_8_um_filter_33_9]